MSDDTNQETEVEEVNTAGAQQAIDVMALYASMIRGQVVENESLKHDEKIAAIMFAADILNKAHSAAIIKLCAIENVSPAWFVGPERATDTAELFAINMVGEKDG